MKASRRFAALSLGFCTLLSPPAFAQPIDAPPPLTNGQSAPEDLGEWQDAEPLLAETDLAAVDAAHADYLRRTDLQLTRPESDVDLTPPAPPPFWLQAVARFLESLGPVFQWIFYAAVAAVAFGVLYFLFGEALRMRLGLRKDRIAKGREDDLIDFRPDAARARSLLEEADALARAGRFAEAVHLLLFRSIEDIQEKLDGGVPTSLTAREIARFDRLPVHARSTLEPVIRIVEHSFFGGRPVDQNGWTTARASYEDFAFGGAWR